MPGKALKPMEVYPSDLSDEEWALLQPLIPPEKPGGRPREVDMRAVQSANLFCVAQRLRLAHAAARLSATQSACTALSRSDRGCGGVGTDHDDVAGTLSSPSRT